jgi:hypothetical protein
MGQLTIQENVAMDFFLAQLYYDNHPVAYEFRKSGGLLVATRHELSELICSLIDHQQGEVEHMGLPPVDKVRGKQRDEEDEVAIQKAFAGGQAGHGRRHHRPHAQRRGCQCHGRQ